MSRDLAVVCTDDKTVAQLEGCIKAGCGKLLDSIELFDIYTGSPIPEGRKSVAFSLSFRADDRTLTDAEADDAVKAALKKLKEELDAELR
ncbi:MAG: hypothetical protein IJG63_07065 [Oscillospiraceae bacterium]|nr:hypothetical protein [Oscillospiraceae bacterium]